MSIRIPVRALANFMTSSSLTQRTVLRNNKYPKTIDGHTRPQIVRYSEAKAAIKKYHKSNNDISVLMDALERLSRKAEYILAHPVDEQGRPKDGSRLNDNIRALHGYMKFFSANKFTVLSTPNLKYTHGNVDVGASLDLYVKERDKYKLIKIDLSIVTPKKEIIDIILKVTVEAAGSLTMPVLPKDVIYVDVERHVVYNGSKLGKGLKKNIDAACENIESLWPGIKQQ